MFRERARTLQGLSVTLDVACTTTAFLLAFLLKTYHDQIPLLRNIPSLPWAEGGGPARAEYAVLLAASTLAWVLTLKRAGGYRFDRQIGLLSALFMQLQAMAAAVLVTGAIVFLLKMGAISRLFFGYFFACSFLLLVARQLGLQWLLKTLRQSDLMKRHALVIGAGKAASWFAKIVQDATEHGYDLVGLLLTRNVVAAETFDVPVLGSVEQDLERTLTDHPVDEVFIVAGPTEMAQLASVAEDLVRRGRVVSLVSVPATGPDGVRARLTEFSGIPMISYGPMPRNEVHQTLKRAMDVAISALALVLFAPVMAGVALAVKLTDPGPAIFVQERLGQGGRHFKLYKFRSMRMDAEQILRSDPALYNRYVQNDYKLPEKEDPRITPIGRFLRKSSLDELPQLWNVLKGDMSLVGPRPIVPAEIEKYAPYGGMLLSVRPGLTGQWQTSGRSTVSYPQRAFIDLDYVVSQNLLADVRILVSTAPAVLGGRGSH